MFSPLLFFAYREQTSYKLKRQPNVVLTTFAPKLGYVLMLSSSLTLSAAWMPLLTPEQRARVEHDASLQHVLAGTLIERRGDYWRLYEALVQTTDDSDQDRRAMIESALLATPSSHASLL
jgi:hypothetical protein